MGFLYHRQWPQAERFFLFKNQGARIIPAFANYIVGNTILVMKEGFVKLEEAAKHVGMNMNEDKTMYMSTIKSDVEIGSDTKKQWIKITLKESGILYI